MLTLDNLTLQRGSKLLFEQVSFSLFAKQKFGIVGTNGSGKSSLLSLILGELSPDKGGLKIQANIKIAHLSQEIPYTTTTAINYIMQGDKNLGCLLQQIAAAEKNHDSIKLSQLHTKMYETDGYAAKSRAAKLLYGLGFATNEHQKAVNEFSGGWQMRLNLAQTLMSEADLLLLDEPTNHLDLSAIVWLEAWLKNYHGALLLISHDREFLDNTTEFILHVENKKIKLYKGNYSSFEEQRATTLANQQQTYQKQQAKIEHLMQFVNRFRAKATKAKQAQSRLRAIEKMGKLAAIQTNTPFTFSFKKTTSCPPPLISCRNVSFSYNKHLVLSKVTLSINPGDRIGLLGLNGAGKSTLIKILANTMPPQTGAIEFNKALKIGYFAQHQIDQLDLTTNPFQHLRQLAPNNNEQQIRTFLGSFNFKNDDVFMPIGSFSGGEKARLVLALIIWQEPNLLLLDEPTNHLDLEMREAIVMALQDYDGAMLLISHDRNLLRTSVDQFLLVANQQVSTFSGDLDDYKNLLLKNQHDNDNNIRINNNRSSLKHNNQHSKPTNSKSKNRVKMLENKLETLYLEKQEIENILTKPATYANKDRTLSQKYTEQLAQTKREIEQIENELLEVYFSL